MESRISRLNLVGAIITLIIFSSLTIYLFIYSTYQNFQERADFTEKTFINNQKRLIKQEVSRVIKDIEVSQKNFQKYQNMIDREISTKDLKDSLINKIKNERFGEKDYGYFWILDKNLNMLMHPIDKEISGKNVKGFLTKDEKLVFQNMLKISDRKENGYLNYIWKNPITDKYENKISYINTFKDFGWIIGTGFYLSDLEKILKNDEDMLDEHINDSVYNAILLTLLAIVLTIVVTLYINRYIKRLEKEQIKNINMLQEYKKVLDTSSIVSKSDLKGNITYVNDKFCKVTGYSKEELIGKNHSILRHPSTPKETFKDMWEALRDGNPWQGIIKNRDKNSRVFYVQMTIIPIKNEHGETIEYIASRNDVTELFEQREHIKKLFNTDSLTNLGNRYKLLTDIDNNTPKAVAMVDIDRFREINNIYGYKIGDYLIIELAKKLLEICERESFTLYRLEADRYALTSTNSINFTKKISKIIDKIASKAFVIKSKEIPVTITSGIAFEEENILVYADIALKIAKQDKKELFVFNKDKLGSVYVNNIDKINLIKKALKNDTVIPFFQPIFNFKTGKIEKFECLMRIKDNDKIISPFEFLDIAKQTKLYPKLTNAMIEKASRIFSNLNYEFSINLTVEDLLNKDTMEFLLLKIKKYKLERKIVLEIVESEHIDNYEEAIQILDNFKKLGVKIAIDDFGSGYSNFDYLIRLKADYVKIDGSIIKGIEKDENARDLLLSIVSFAKKSKMKIIAEFVSSESIAKILRDMDVDYAQGFYYGKPIEEVINS